MTYEHYEKHLGQVGGIQYEANLYTPSDPNRKFEVRCCQTNVWADPTRRYNYGYRVFSTPEEARAFIEDYIAGKGDRS